jgi:hypothetical protein
MYSEPTRESRGTASAAILHSSRTSFALRCWANDPFYRERLWQRLKECSGYTAFKLHTWQPPIPGAPDPRRDVAACQAVRETVGDEVALMLDPYHYYSRCVSFQFLSRLAQVLDLGHDFGWEGTRFSILVGSLYEPADRLLYRMQQPLDLCRAIVQMRRDPHAAWPEGNHDSLLAEPAKERLIAGAIAQREYHDRGALRGVERAYQPDVRRVVPQPIDQKLAKRAVMRVDRAEPDLLNQRKRGRQRTQPQRIGAAHRISATRDTGSAPCISLN